LGDAKSGPCHVAFTPDGKRALVTRDGDHRISVLSVDGIKVEDTKAYMVAGIRPYSISISSRGDVAVLTNQGGGQGDTDIVSVIDLKKSHRASSIPSPSARSPRLLCSRPTARTWPSPSRTGRSGQRPTRPTTRAASSWSIASTAPSSPSSRRPRSGVGPRAWYGARTARLSCHRVC